MAGSGQIGLERLIHGVRPPSVGIDRAFTLLNETMVVNDLLTDCLSLGILGAVFYAGRGSSASERGLHKPEVVGSSPTPATTLRSSSFGVAQPSTQQHRGVEQPGSSPGP